MGTNDAREQLEVAKAECVRLEQENARLAAVIEEAQDEARASSVPLGMPEALFYRRTLRSVESALAAADTDAALREVRAAAIREAANRLVHHLPPVEQLHGMADRIRQGEDER